MENGSFGRRTTAFLQDFVYSYAATQLQITYFQLRGDLRSNLPSLLFQTTISFREMQVATLCHKESGMRPAS
jgi:hypothetical protein